MANCCQDMGFLGGVVSPGREQLSSPRRPRRSAPFGSAPGALLPWLSDCGREEGPAVTSPVTGLHWSEGTVGHCGGGAGRRKLWIHLAEPLRAEQVLRSPKGLQAPQGLSTSSPSLVENGTLQGFFVDDEKWAGMDASQKSVIKRKEHQFFCTEASVASTAPK